MTIGTYCTSNEGFGYNIRLIEYPNGSAQIRLYDTPLVAIPENPYESDELPPGTIIEPFSGSLVREINDFTDLEPKINPLECRRISLARTKRVISDYARCVCWEWFCTFTFSPEKAERTNYEKCCQQMRTWLKNNRDRKAPHLKYLAVPELHKDMESWHFHVLMADTGNIVFTDSDRIDKGQKIYNLSGWRFGYSTATKVREVFRVQKYIVKYMTKECHRMSRGAHRYFVSQGLPKPKQTLYLAEKGEESDIVKQIENDLKLKITYISHSKPGGYTDVTYIELQPDLANVSNN